jgi:hypothetical protein
MRRFDMKKIELAYRQNRSLAVTVCQRAFSKIRDSQDHRRPELTPQEMLEAILGRVSPMSATLGLHPGSRTQHHPTHQHILRALIRRTGGSVAGEVARLAVDALEENAVVVGGPIASRHAAAIFGTPERPSVLGIELPVRYELPSVPDAVDFPIAVSRTVAPSLGPIAAALVAIEPEPARTGFVSGGEGAVRGQ